MSITIEQPSVRPPVLPRLENGDHLTAEEFERRYDAMPDLKKAELIEGIVYIAPPVSFEFHGAPHFDLIGWLCFYRTFTPGIRGGDNSTLRLPLENRPQPDAFLIIEPSHAGQVRIDQEGYVIGGPELVAEVAASSVSYDVHEKPPLFLQNGVREYLVWRVLDRAIDWWVLRGDHYEPLPRSATGVWQSEVLPGLWLDTEALVNGNMMQVHQVLQQGLASAEHAAFVARLQQAWTQGQSGS